MKKSEKLSLFKGYKKISDTQEICGILKTTKSEKLSSKINFQELNRAAKRSGLFNDRLFKEAEKIREERNRIHTYSLKEVDDKYTKAEIDEIFAITKTIIERVESY